MGAWVQDWTKAQAALSRRDSRTVALRGVMADLLDSVPATTYVLKKIAGVSLRYDLGGDHPLVGRLAPQLPRVGDAGADGRFVLVDLGEHPELTALAERWRDRVETLRVSAPDVDAPALLIRPDGFVCWAGSTADSDAWSTWLGNPVHEEVAAST